MQPGQGFLLLLGECMLWLRVCVGVYVVCVGVCVLLDLTSNSASTTLENLTLTSLLSPSLPLPSFWSPARLPACLNPVLSCPCPYRRGQPAKPGLNRCYCSCCSATADHLDPELELSCLGLVHTC